MVKIKSCKSQISQSISLIGIASLDCKHIPASVPAKDNLTFQICVQLLEKILDNCSPRSLASLEATCNHFEASSCQSYARGRLQNLPKAHQVLIPL